MNERDPQLLLDTSAAWPMAEHYDFLARTDTNNVDSYYDAPNTADLYWEFNAIGKQSWYLHNIQDFLYILLLHQDENAEALLKNYHASFTDKYKMGLSEQEIQDLLNLDRLPPIEIEKILEIPDKPFHDLYRSYTDDYHRDVYGCDKGVRRLVVYTCGEQRFYSIFQLVRYGNEWFVEELSEDIFALDYREARPRVAELSPERLQDIEDILAGREIITEEKELGSARIVGLKSTNGLYGLLDKQTGQVITTPVYSTLRIFSEGLAFAKQEDRCVYIDETGTEVIELGPEVKSRGILRTGSPVYSPIKSVPMSQ